jgi:hypothetical protein
VLARLALGSVAMAAGVVMNAVPDPGRSVVSLGSEHGLSVLDLVGVAVLLAGWLIIATGIWRRRARILDRIAPQERIGAAFAAGVGLGLLSASLFNEWPWWWVLATALLIAVQARAVVLALRP